MTYEAVAVEAGLLDIERIRVGAQSQRIGRRLLYMDSVDSTNDVVWRHVENGGEGQGETDGLVVLAEHQSGGRGRLGRRWQSPRGASVLCSFALIDERHALAGGEVGLAAAVALHDSITTCTELRPAIKWPNDVLIGGRKVGGILVESRRRPNGDTAYVVGIGVNCMQQQGHFPPELHGTATSLELESRLGIDRTGVAIALLTALNRWVVVPEAWCFETVRDAWLARAEPMGQHVHVRHAGSVYTGTMLDIDPTAALLVQLDEGGVRAFNAVDTTIVEG